MKTNFTSRLLVALLAVSFIASSCKNDGADPAPTIAAPSTANFKDMRAKALADLTQKKDFKVADGLDFTTAKGARIQISANCLRDQSGALATGDATLSFVEIYDRGNMVVANKPVMGINADGKKEPLVTGGQYNLKITQGDKELTSGCVFSVSLPASHTGGLDNDMKLWNGIIDQDGNLAWDEIEPGDKEGGLNMNGENTTYSIWGTAFGWTNVDRFYSDPRPKTKIKVTLPAGYNNDNTGVYLAYEDQPNLLAQLDTWDSAGKFFTEHYGFVPIGMSLHVVFVSESNGALAYSIKKVTIAADAVIHIEQQDIATSTKQELINRINSLQ
ncbi:hypothetical protein [Sphingobacterium paucimobilis]|uniref:Uncharacterized protein n=1 Tax=Sphingobacterium paucimobilis HER1398 TaxID=1346330 RepID=U2HEU4_9SPHI|nr:hypothetical protein [Sphingobacterium paucimobilis]ERJ57835.1 hypothetical protein M472_03555 [Sphingobacterium paucimobilis HER1398]ERJ60286.1 hypothetical protein M472_16125 [Sphingobacterium paucimobilis HER1398]